jgi:peptide/nickel transport system permease protein
LFADRQVWLLAAKVAPFFALVVVAATYRLWVPFDPQEVVARPARSPSGEHWFGTDSAGMDVFSRVVAATGVDLVIGLGSMALATAIGIVLGLVVGVNEERGGVLGMVARSISRFVDLFQALPSVVTVMIAASFFGVSVGSLIVLTGVILSPIQIRLVRTEVLRVRSEAYLDASRMAGLSERAIAVRNVFPNSTGPAFENLSVLFGAAIMVTGALGFLGIGIAPPTAEWGSIINAGLSDATVGRWWTVGFASLALAITVAAFVLFAHAVIGPQARRVRHAITVRRHLGD